jgi:hypothetical protein
VSGLDTDIWVCANCRSVNKLRAKQCYNCRTPKERAAVDPADVDVTTQGRVREIPLPDFEASRPFAYAATLFIVIVASAQVVSAVVSWSLVLRTLDGSTASEAEIVEAGLIALATLGLALLALVGWSAWLSRAVSTMPALGLGYPAANGMMAFIENFLPGLNLLRIPAILRDMVGRLEPSGSGAASALIFAAWIGLFGGFIIPRVGGFLNLYASETLEGYARNQLVVEGVSIALVLIGAAFLVALIWWIEGRIARRRIAQLADVTPPSAISSGMSHSAGPAIPDAVAPRVAVPVAAKPAAGPLGALPPARPFDELANRSITSATRAGSVPAERPGRARVADAGSPPPAALPRRPSGPRLQLIIADHGAMTASLDGVSESITLAELVPAAAALASADGSVSITTGSGPEPRAIAQDVLRIFADAGVATTHED